ncbi:MAG: polysaccharide deacetylase family protein [Polyangiaceae bacterium]|jgi:peptidoglycan/xylan/chitin deacetylase (PgdA/CDA1 family)|nr:polysaccharide deacetylase family protein [Polyangiaceae bacterium]
MTFGRTLLCVASAGGLALLVRSLVFGPVPLWVALAALLGYVAVAVAGVLVPQLEMYANIVWRGDRDCANVALTFDDGPHPVHTRKVLDMLDAAGAAATFFVLGSKVDAHPDVLREIAARGHDIGVHGYDHDRLMSLRSVSRVEADLRKAMDSIARETGRPPTLFRPPVGHVSPRTETAARRLRLTLVAWSVRGRDGLSSAQPSKVAARIVRGLRRGSIVLLHDAAEQGDRQPAGVSALPRVLDAIMARNLEVVPVRTMIPTPIEHAPEQ